MAGSTPQGMFARTQLDGAMGPGGWPDIRKTMEDSERAPEFCETVAAFAGAKKRARSRPSKAGTQLELRVLHVVYVNRTRVPWRTGDYGFLGCGRRGSPGSCRDASSPAGLVTCVLHRQVRLDMKHALARLDK